MGLNFIGLGVLGYLLAEFYLLLIKPLQVFKEQLRNYQADDFSGKIKFNYAGPTQFLQEGFYHFKEKIEGLNNALKKAEEYRTEFASIVSHEMRTPLTSIAGYAKLLAAGDAGEVTSTQKEFLCIIDKNAERLTELISDFLDIERMDTVQVQLDLRAHDLHSIIKDCCDTLRVMSQEKGLDLRITGLKTPLCIVGDRHRLVQIFMNLISNAIKYTKSGFVEIGVSQSDYKIIVTVKDSGIGISPEDQAQLFQKYYRASSGLSATEDGFGLGLLIVKKLLLAHGGSISVESCLGKGSSFTVHLPLSKEVLEGVRDLGTKASQKMIWIMDPNEEDLKVMVDWIRVAIHEKEIPPVTLSSFSSLESLPKVNHHSEAPALLVVDFKDPNANSFVISDLYEKLHESIPVLVVSNGVDASTAFAEGASAWLTKPLEKRSFVSSIKELLVRTTWKILVADSNTDLRILVKRALEQKGLKVDDVDRGNDVLGRVVKEHYDLLLLDMHLKDVPGMELMKIIQRSPRLRGVPIFMMAMEDQKIPSRPELKKMGVSQFLPKQRGLNFVVESIFKHLEDKKFIDQPN